MSHIPARKPAELDSAVRRYYPPFAPRWMRLQEVTLPVEE